MGIRRPVGVVGAIAPWNAALILSARSFASPIALGNTVVLKPSEHSPYVGGLLWGDIFSEAGLPDGVLNIVTHAPGEAGPIGDELVENPAVRRDQLHRLDGDGSQARGGRRAEPEARPARARRLNPLIVLADADLESAVDAAAFGSFLHQGQICMSARRIIVEQPIAEEFVERLVEKTKTLKAGDPKEQDTIIGPLITDEALATVKSRVDDAVAKGAKVLVGGEAEGPVLPRNAARGRAGPSSRASRRSARWRRSRSWATQTRPSCARTPRRYGLSAGIITSDPDRGLALAQHIESGIVHVNDQPVADEPQMPFGGVKDSGYGRFGGRLRSTSSPISAG